MEECCFSLVSREVVSDKDMGLRGDPRNHWKVSVEVKWEGKKINQRCANEWNYCYRQLGLKALGTRETFYNMPQFC